MVLAKLRIDGPGAVRVGIDRRRHRQTGLFECGPRIAQLDGRGLRFPALLLVAQRLVYRQIMYWVVLRAIAAAIGGWTIGWGKLERSGRADMAGA